MRPLQTGWDKGRGGGAIQPACQQLASLTLQVDIQAAALVGQSIQAQMVGAGG
jgi:hypothetical protein